MTARRAVTGIAASLCLCACVRASEPRVVFSVGSLTARPGESALSVPIVLELADAYAAGWGVALQYDPSVLTVSAIESAIPSDAFRFFDQNELGDGLVGAGCVLDLFGDPNRYLKPGYVGPVAYVRFCVLPEAPAGEYPLRLLRAVRGFKASAGTDCGCYEGEFSGGGFAGSSLEIEPVLIGGTLRVSGERMDSSECTQWVPTPAPVPKVSYRLSAPARVEAGASFEARLELTTDTPIAGLSAAMAVEPERIAVEAVEPNPALFMDVYAFIASVGKDGTIGIAMIPDLLGNGSILPGEHILVARILCAARPDAPEGLGALSFVSKVVHDETQLVATDLYYGRNDNSGLIYQNRVGLRLEDTVSVFDPEILAGWAEVGSLAGAALELRAERLFSRGDADRNGHVAITDAIVILRYLFSGDAALPCEDAADSDDSGALDIADAIFVLRYLFGGGNAPPAPGPDAAGRDPTADELGCLE